MPVAAQFLPAVMAQPSAAPSAATNAPRAGKRQKALRDISDSVIASASAVGSASNAPSEIEIFTLKHAFAVAKARNAYNLIENIIAKCKSRQVDLHLVFSPFPPITNPAACSHPLEILQLVSSSTGYCQARTLLSNGQNMFFHNVAFEHEIKRLEDINRCYAANQEEVYSTFMHPDDVMAIHESVGEIWPTAVGRQCTLVSKTVPKLLRVNHRLSGVSFMCVATAHMHVNRDEGIVSGVLELHPQPQPLNGQLGAAAPAVMASSGRDVPSAGAGTFNACGLPISLAMNSLDEASGSGDPVHPMGATPGRAANGAPAVVSESYLDPINQRDLEQLFDEHFPAKMDKHPIRVGGLRG